MRFEFIFVHRKIWPITITCRVMQVSRDGYNSWVRSKPKREEGHEQERKIIEAATKVWEESQRAYGEPRIRISLERNGLRLGAPAFWWKTIKPGLADFKAGWGIR
jgi:putative transposase